MNCPDCAGTVKENGRDHFQCCRCGAEFEQMTIEGVLTRMGKASRDKGMRGEREFAAAVDGQKIPLSGAAGGEFGNDVVMPNGMRAEVKRFKSGEKTLYNWIMDEREKPDLVGFRADRKPWIVAMKLTKFLPIMRANMAAAAMLKYTDADGAPMPGLRAEFAGSIKALREALGVGEETEADREDENGF